MGETILVCKQQVSFSNDFGSYMEAGFETTFTVKDVEEGERMAEFFNNDGNRGIIKPLRIMKAGHGIIYKEYKV